jgi:serine/threonine protein kinase
MRLHRPFCSLLHSRLFWIGKLACVTGWKRGPAHNRADTPGIPARTPGRWRSKVAGRSLFRASRDCISFRRPVVSWTESPHPTTTFSTMAGGTPSSYSDRDTPIETISHYRIIQKIGAGGMGEAYRAHDDQLKRDVAITAFAELSSPDHSNISATFFRGR